MTRTTYSAIGLCAALLTTPVMAQRLDQTLPGTETHHPQPTGVYRPEVQIPQNGARGGGDVVWTEDFSNGMAGANPSGAWTVAGDNGDIWRINANAPRGAYTQNDERISSTTFANGFAKFASDSANSSWSGATPTALDPNTFISWDGSLVSPVIDLSANPLVEIEFQQRSRYCCGESPFFLEISTDGGETWPTVIMTNEGLPENQGAPGTNTTSATTETRTFSIASAIAENPSNVQFRFHHDGTKNTSHYYWQIDDIKISLLPDNEIVMNYAYTSSTGEGEEYGRIPVGQLPAELNVGAEVYNYGGQDQTNVVVTCSVTNAGGTEVFSSVANVGTIAAGDTVVTDENPTLPTLPVGSYTATFTVTSDQSDLDIDPSDNVRVRKFEVTDFVYSLDNLGFHPAGLETFEQVGTASFTDNPEGTKLMTMYDVNTEMQVTGLEIGLGSNSRVGTGASIKISILDTADVLSTPSVVTNFVDGIESDWVNITQANIQAGVITIEFPSPVNLTPRGYYAVATLRGNGTQTPTTDPEVYIKDDTTVPQPALGSGLWIPFDINDDGSEGRHFYGGNGTAWAIRMTTNPTISIAENAELKGVTMFPNPTNGILRVNTTTSEKYTVDVMNVLGELVMTNKFTGMTTLDLGTFSKGIYNVRVSNGTQSTVQRVALN